MLSRLPRKRSINLKTGLSEPKNGFTNIAKLKKQALKGISGLNYACFYRFLLR